MNQNTVLGNRSDDIRIDELADQILGRRVVDVRRVDIGCVAVLGKLRLLELFVVGSRVVVRIGIRYNGSRSTHPRVLHASRRARETKLTAPPHRGAEIREVSPTSADAQILGLKPVVGECIDRIEQKPLRFPVYFGSNYISLKEMK